MDDISFSGVERAVPGGQILATDWIENYPGFPDGLNGVELAARMTDPAKWFHLPMENGPYLIAEQKYL